MARAILITGSNAGDVRGNIATSRNMISAEVGNIVMESSVYESAPWGNVAGEEGKDGMPDNFFNQVLVVNTDLQPEELLDTVQQIEKELGRERKKEFCHGYKREYYSRTMDIDILFYDDIIMDTPRLTIPHPLLHKREFVLILLVELVPELIHPVENKTASQLLKDFDPQDQG